MLSKMLRASVNNTTNPTYTDANFNQVSLLLHGDGTNGAQNNTFLDSSTNNFTITRNGNTTQGTNTPFSQADGYWSNYFTGSSSYLSTPNVAALQLGAGDFTVEAWVYPNYVTNTYGSPICGTYGFVSSQDRGWAFQLTAAGKFSLFLGGSSGTGVNTSSTNTIVANTWTHLAAVRSGTTVTLYVNGVANGTGTNSVNENYSVVNFNIATSRADNIAPATGNSGNSFGGNISNLRIVKGTAVYTSAFTPSTTPLTAITNTQLLTCQSNYFKDNSSNNFTLTATGTPSVQPFSPFAPTSAYSTSVNGGSMYFNKTTDSLTSPTNTALSPRTGNWTFECWVYLSSVTGYQGIFDYGQYGGGVLLRTNNASLDYYELGGYVANIASVFTASVWTHIAVSRNSGTLKIFKDGVQIYSGASSGDINPSSPNNYVRIGAQSPTPTFFLGGYISNARYLVGTGLYTTAFTPPTAPLTAITNTQLLLSGTNAGIYDNAIKNNLETVGNAQVSTSVVKYGTGSMYFDGTGDWLTSPDTPNLQLGTGNFTIEGWVYLNAIGSARGFISKGTSTTGWSLSTNSSNQVVFSYASSTITSTGTLSVSTWYFVTVVRSGTGTNLTKIYIDGTNDGTGTVATDFNQTSIMYVGADRVAGSALNGYIDDLRITKGIARYTATFTPPTSAFPNQ